MARGGGAHEVDSRQDRWEKRMEEAPVEGTPTDEDEVRMRLWIARRTRRKMAGDDDDAKRNRR